MKIIDKGTRKDFYDYIAYQYPDSSTCFDRRKAQQFDKTFIASWMSDDRKFIHNYSLFIICIGYTRWLFSVSDVKHTYLESDYKLRLVSQWKDYNNREFMTIKVPDLYWGYAGKSEEEKAEAIKNNQIPIKDFKTYGWNSFDDKNGLFLKDAGFASILKPEDVYWSLDEYFCSLASEKEGGPSKDLSDVDKALNHGFDKKVSFRNIK